MGRGNRAVCLNETLIKVSHKLAKKDWFTFANEIILQYFFVQFSFAKDLLKY